jgi:hypothetical protein
MNILLGGKADVGHSHTEFPRVWTTSPGRSTEDGRFVDRMADVKICVNAQANLWHRLLLTPE